jgi:hypothetical protein
MRKVRLARLCRFLIFLAFGAFVVWQIRIALRLPWGAWL